MNTNSKTAPKVSFFKGLREEVFFHLKNNQITHIDQKGMLTKAIISYSLWICTYSAFLIIGYFFSWYGLLLVIPCAFAMMCIVLGVMHDGSHGTFARAKWLNQLAAYSLGFAGASSLIWHKSHVRDHHDNTNVMHLDQDFESGGLLRLHPEQSLKKPFRYQQFYAWFLYLGFALRWILIDDIQDLCTNRCKFNRAQRWRLFWEIAIVKSWHVVVFFLVPALIMGWQIALVFYLAHWMLLSISLLLVFAMAHLSSVQDMPAQKGKHDDWALHQLATTANFAPNNRALSWVIGGLNYQIEHHIFPKISHTRYPVIRELVKSYCKKHGVEYMEYPTFFSVIKAHYTHLKQLGKTEPRTYPQ